MRHSVSAISIDLLLDLLVSFSVPWVITTNYCVECYHTSHLSVLAVKTVAIIAFGLFIMSVTNP